MRNLLMTAGISFAASLVLMRLWIAVLERWRMKQVIRDDGPETHLKKSGTLTMGGVAFFCAWIFGVLISTGIGDPKVKMIVIVSAVCCLLGFTDDLAKFMGRKTEGVKARYKLIVEIALGVFLAMFMIYLGSRPDAPQTDPLMIWMPRWFGGLSLGVFFIPFVIVVFVGTLNSVNLNDGLDGLMAGCVTAILISLMLFVNKYGDRTLMPLMAALTGSVAGFLWYNAHPARVFAGDTGSLFLGGALASVAVIARLELFLFVAGGVLVLEAMSVVLQVASFRLTGKRLLPMAPLHHTFEKLQWQETAIVIRFWIVSIIFAALALWMFAR